MSKLEEFRRLFVEAVLNFYDYNSLNKEKAIYIECLQGLKESFLKFSKSILTERLLYKNNKHISSNIFDFQDELIKCNNILTDLKKEDSDVSDLFDKLERARLYIIQNEEYVRWLSMLYFICPSGISELFWKECDKNFISYTYAVNDEFIARTLPAYLSSCILIINRYYKEVDDKYFSIFKDNVLIVVDIKDEQLFIVDQSHDYKIILDNFLKDYRLRKFIEVQLHNNKQIMNKLLPLFIK